MLEDLQEEGWLMMFWGSIQPQSITDPPKNYLGRVSLDKLLPAPLAIEPLVI